MEKKVVSAEENKILKKMFWNSHLVFSNFNMTKMEANGFTMTMAPAVESIYGDDIEGKKAAYARHQSFFNTHAVAFNFIAGLCYALEKDCHDGKVPGETIDAIKASLMGPTRRYVRLHLLQTACVSSVPVSQSVCARRAISSAPSSSSCCMAFRSPCSNGSC